MNAARRESTGSSGRAEPLLHPRLGGRNSLPPKAPGSVVPPSGRGRAVDRLRPARRRRIRRFPGARVTRWAAGLLVALAVSTAFIGGGAHADVLVSNMGQTPETDFRGGADTPAAVYSGQLARQLFRTGGLTHEFVLTSVELSISNVPDVPDDMVVSIYSAVRSGFDWVADDLVHTLENPDSFSIGANTFEAPTGATLDTNTRYFVSVTYPHGTVLTLNLVLNITNSTSEDEAQSGWSISNLASETASYANAPYMIRINGERARPVITDVSVTSQPLAGDTYGWGETIEVQVTFDREVVVSGTPVVSLTVGDDWRGANCTGGSGTNVLTCHYQVVEDDTDTDGITIHASNSAGSHGLVGTGSSITDEEFGSTANRAYSKQTNLSGHKVAGRPSGDAKLSALALSDGTNPIALHQTFDAQTTAYTAEVGNTVGTITVTPTTNDDYATVAYLDAANAVLADTDTITDHHQVALDVGANTIKVRVTAENTTTTKTYTVRVNRLPANLDAPTNLVAVPVSETRVHLYWGAPLNFALGGLTGYEYRVSSDDGHTWFRPWRDIQGAGNRADITEHTVHWLDSANEYTFQVRAENALGGGISASVKARPGKPAVSRPTLTIENVTGEDNVIAGKRDATRPVQQGSLVNGVFVGNGTYHDSCHEDAFAHYRIRATGGDHLWRPGSRFQGVSVGVEYRRAGRNGERSSAGVSSSVTGLVGRIAGSIVPGNRHWDRKNCIATEGADRGPLIVRLVPGEGYFVGRPRAICIRVDHEDNGTVVTGTPCPNVLEENAADPLPVMAVSDASANEANGSIGFLVSLDKPAAGTVTVDYRTENVTATAPGDYTQTSGTLTFDPGETQKMVTVPIIDDTVPDNGETFKLVLSNVSGAKLGDAEAVGTILNTETPILTGFTLVNAETGSDIGAIDDSGMLTLDDPAKGSYGLVAAVASDAGVGSVRLALTGAKTATATDDAAPYSLYGDEDGTVTGAGLPAGSYTLSATAFAEAAGGGAALGTLSVSFSVAASEAVDPDALTASFEGVPEVHDGSSPFTFRVRFSLEPRVSYTVLRDESFAVTGGDVDKARRVDGRNDLREIHIEPKGWDDVTVMLAGGRACGTEGAICTADGKVLANTAVATVPGPLALSVADARVDEAPGAVLAFEVTLNRAAGGTVTVGYATADSTATAGADYTATSGTLTFAAGETSRTVNVAVLDDAHDEGEETLTLTLSNPSGAYLADGTATGTIENTDAMPKAWLARFGRTVSGQVLDAVEERLRASRTAGVAVRLAGQPIGLTAPPDAKSDATTEAEKENQARLGVLSDWLRQETEDRERTGIQSRTLTAPEVLMGSSFALAAETDSGGSAAVWGRMARSSFSGREAGLSLDGDVTTGLLGADYAQGPWTGGAVLSHSSGEGGYSGDAAGKVEASMTALTPWAGYKVTERLSVWGALGYGTGELTLTPKNPLTQKDQPAQRTDIAMTLAAAGVRGTLLEGDGPKLDAVADARWVRTTSDKVTASAGNGGNLSATQADVTRLRLGLEGSWAVALDDEGATVTPRLSLGVRHDGGDAETGFGADIGGGVTLAMPAHGLSVSLEGRGLLTHEAKGMSDTGFGASIAWDPAPSSKRGLSLSLRQSVGGSATGGTDALFSREAMDGLAANGNSGNQRLEGKIGYGLPVFGDRFTGTPEIGFGLSDGGRDYSLGLRLTREGRDAGSFEFSLEAERRETANDNAPEHGIGFRLTARW